MPFLTPLVGRGRVLNLQSPAPKADALPLELSGLVRLGEKLLSGYQGKLDPND